MSRPRAVRCPRCGRISWNPTDIAEGYCGWCHDWTTVRPGTGNAPGREEGTPMTETTPEGAEPDVDAAPAPLETDGTAEQGTSEDSLPAETPVAPGQVDNGVETGQQENPMAGENSMPTLLVDNDGVNPPEVQTIPPEAQQPEALDGITVSTPLVETGPGPQDEQVPDDQPAAHAPFDPSGRPDPELAPGGHS